MVLVMVEHPSGYEYSSHEAAKGSEEEKLEVDSEKTTFYYSDLDTAKEVTICMTKTQDVANPRPFFITVQDYYNPDAKSTLEISLDGKQVKIVNFHEYHLKLIIDFQKKNLTFS
jgi:hypothetical protein